MERLRYPLSHEWRVAVNRYCAELRQSGKEWPSFMYEAISAADEVPRMIMMFKKEREGDLPKNHQQCSMQALEKIDNNHLACCLGTKTRECPHLLALEKNKRCPPEDIDIAKAWTCASHIIGAGGDIKNEGYILTVGDRMYWDNLHASLAACEDE